MPKISEQEEKRRVDAYHDTENDRQLSLRLGIARPAAVAWRRSRYLPSKTPNKSITESEEIRRLAAYEQTRNDHEAAMQLGISHASFARWRNSRGYDAKSPNGKKRRQPSADYVTQLRRENVNLREKLNIIREVIQEILHETPVSTQTGTDTHSVVVAEQTL